MDTGLEFIEPASAQHIENDSLSSPSHSSQSRKIKALPIIAIILIILALIIIPIVFRDIFQNQKPNISGNNQTTTPTVSDQNLSPTISPTPAVQKSELKISIENGTGIPREAAFLKQQLENIGFGNFELGNADNDKYESTKIYYSSRVSEDIKNELENTLDKLYDSLDNPEKIENSDIDIKIITGTRPGVTKKIPVPTAKTNESTSSAITITQTPSTTPSNTPTLKATNTPTSISTNTPTPI